jgi:transaldolase
LELVVAIFLDTGDVEDIKTFHRMGILRGVTTNPSILLKHGVVGGMKGIEERARQLAELIQPLPLSVEVTTTDRAETIDQALQMRDWGENIVVKVPIHGPNGEMDNLEAVHELESRHDVRVNVTAMMSAQQCMLAALAGASYVSIFGGRVNNMGYDSCIEIARLRRVLDSQKLASKIIVGSTREVLNVIEWIEAGAHIVTVVPDLVAGMLVHPYSKETVQMFMRDAAATSLEEIEA